MQENKRKGTAKSGSKNFLFFQVDVAIRFAEIAQKNNIVRTIPPIIKLHNLCNTVILIGGSHPEPYEAAKRML